jgi:hypothetical protein
MVFSARGDNAQGPLKMIGINWHTGERQLHLQLTLPLMHIV